MIHRFKTTSEMAHKLTKESKKHGFYFKTLTRTTKIEEVVCETTEPGYDYIQESNIQVTFLTK